MPESERLLLRLCARLVEMVRAGIVEKCPAVVDACEQSGELYALEELAEVFDKWSDGHPIEPDVRAIAVALQTDTAAAAFATATDDDDDDDETRG
jgi:hypothetical protein